MSIKFYTVGDWRKHIAEFRQYGYNPYDSEALDEWFSYNWDGKKWHERA